MNDRDRLAADLAASDRPNRDPDQADYLRADRLLALGWTRLDAERARIRAAVKAAPLYGGWTREDDVPHYVDVEYVLDAIDDA